LIDKKDVRTEFRVIHPEGRIVYLNWNVKNVFSEDGRLHKVSGTLQDMTEHIETEIQLRDYAQSLEKINKELDQFAYIVSHDLKAPLRAINNLSVWIEEDLEGKMEEDTKKNFGMLRGRIHRLETLINGILQYSRAGRIKAETDEIELNPFIDDLISNLSPPENFQFIIQENLPVLNMEKIALDQVFTNFLSNTIKYNSNPTPVVKVLCEERPLQYEFCVEDNGPGIDKEFHEKVFQIFQTLQARDKFESTGVGLAIVKKIIEEKGGKAWVESELGNGSKFFFTIPKTEKAIN
jgi:light-regulated signal transduction histidine kinase (bacteriophytochrome)